ncbi:HAD-IC family P-type ATPase [Candidatus Saccharibacteria bacterium]|nr:HAD-IC family P-type ATPase [Candidatus Saccharibacteria bacterium]
MKHSIAKIIFKNTFTLFNLVNVILAVMVLIVGSPKNALFLGVAIANTLISIINEVRAKKIVDKLKLLSEKQPTILKNGQPTEVPLDEVSKGDILILKLGDQIPLDARLKQGTIEVNESFVTGEQDNIEKHPGDRLISGSFVVAGSAEALVESTTADSFISKLQSEASAIKTADSKLFRLMNNIVKYISYALIPIGALLLWSRFRTEPDGTTAVTSTVAALINMIPEGLILLTSSVLALATVRLSRKKVLVQDLYATETLARVDCFCLDKTGTLTTGKMTVHDYKSRDESFYKAIKSILSTTEADNATTSALKKSLALDPKFQATSEFTKITEVIPFSSDRKYSGIRVGDTKYLLGAIDFLTSDKKIINKIKSESSGYRTLVVMRDGTDLLGVIHLTDEIRSTAHDIIKYFYDNNIDIKIISGDDLGAVTEIANRVGVKDLHGVNLSELKSKNYTKLVKDYGIFTRVTPSEKKQLVAALRKEGRTVAMTGDGVNDILAMKEADVSIAIGEGADAARRAAKFVLLDSGYEAVPAIIDEGRQSINNLERSTTLFLAKTVYASILAVLFVVLPLSYPYSPIEMSLLNFLCIGAPGVILALEKNTARPKDKFKYNITHYSIPIGITVSIAMLVLSIVARFANLEHSYLITLSYFITFVIDVVLVYLISRPLNKLRFALLAGIIIIALAALFIPFSRTFFEFALPF